MQISAPNYDEWGLFRSKELPPSKWWSYVSADRGWWVEARIQVDAVSGSPGYGQGLRVHDGRTDIQLKLAFNDVLLLTPKESHYAVDVRAFHVYRLQRPSAELVQLLVDGKQVLSVATPEQDKGGAGSLTFGSIDQNMPAQWDYISYDTAAPGREQIDDDQDGISLDRDLCPTLKDDGKDSDWDRLGDACDPCVNDELNDSDGDGLCADQDICPRNANNPDANGNGLCDDDECVAGMPKGYEFAAPGAEGAEVCHTAGLSCACYNRAKANCSPKTTCASGCDCRFAGGSSSTSSGGGAGMQAGSAGTAPSNPSTGGGGTGPGFGDPAGAPSASTPVAAASGAAGTAPSTVPSGMSAAGAPVSSPSAQTSGCALALGHRLPSTPALSLSLLGLSALWRLRRRSRPSAPRRLRS